MSLGRRENKEAGRGIGGCCRREKSRGAPPYDRAGERVGSPLAHLNPYSKIAPGHPEKGSHPPLFFSEILFPGDPFFPCTQMPTVLSFFHLAPLKNGRNLELTPYKHSKERRDEIIEMFNGGMTAMQIQKKLGLHSRNIVAGIIYRAQQRGERVAKPGGIRTGIRAGRPRKRPPKDPRAPRITIRPVTSMRQLRLSKDGERVLDLNSLVDIVAAREGQCRWVYGTRMCCGIISQDGKSYCDYHHGLVYQVEQRR